jgi:hypothetical protein
MRLLSLSKVLYVNVNNAPGCGLGRGKGDTYIRLCRGIAGYFATAEERPQRCQFETPFFVLGINAAISSKSSRCTIQNIKLVKFRKEERTITTGQLLSYIHADEMNTTSIADCAVAGCVDARKVDTLAAI